MARVTKPKFDPLTMPRELPLAEFSKFSVEDRIAWGLKIKKPEISMFAVSTMSFGKRKIICLLTAESPEDARNKLLGFAESEEEFKKFYDRVFLSRDRPCPYLSAVDDSVFLSSDDGFEEEQCYKTRVEFIETLVVDERRLPTF